MLMRIMLLVRCADVCPKQEQVLVMDMPFDWNVQQTRECIEN